MVDDVRRRIWRRGRGVVCPQKPLLTMPSTGNGETYIFIYFSEQIYPPPPTKYRITVHILKTKHYDKEKTIYICNLYEIAKS